MNHGWIDNPVFTEGFESHDNFHTKVKLNFIQIQSFVRTSLRVGHVKVFFSIDLAVLYLEGGFTWELGAHNSDILRS